MKKKFKIIFPVIGAAALVATVTPIIVTTMNKLNTSQSMNYSYKQLAYYDHNYKEEKKVLDSASIIDNNLKLSVIKTTNTNVRFYMEYITNDEKDLDLKLDEGIELKIVYKQKLYIPGKKIPTFDKANGNKYILKDEGTHYKHVYQFDVNKLDSEKNLSLKNGEINLATLNISKKVTILNRTFDKNELITTIKNYVAENKNKDLTKNFSQEYINYQKETFKDLFEMNKSIWKKDVFKTLDLKLDKFKGIDVYKFKFELSNEYILEDMVYKIEFIFRKNEHDTNKQIINNEDIANTKEKVNEDKKTDAINSLDKNDKKIIKKDENKQKNELKLGIKIGIGFWIAIMISLIVATPFIIKKIKTKKH